MRRIWSSAAITLAFVVSVGSAIAGPAKFEVAGRSEELPLGPPGLPETRASDVVAPGVTYTRIERGFTSERDFFTVDVAFTATRAEAIEVRRRLDSEGFDANIVTIAERAPDDPAPGPLGYVIRTGRFSMPEDAQSLHAELIALGYAGARVVYTGEDGFETTGPWVVHVLQIDPDSFDGLVDTNLATEIVPERELLSSMVARTGAAAGINGGYFVIGDADGTPGDLAGISVVDGELVSEAIRERTSLWLPDSGEDARIGVIETRMRASTSAGESLVVDGLNRKPGLIRSCGGVGGDQPTQAPKHDFTCTDGSELIVFTPDFGATTEPGDGVEAVLDSSGTVVELRTARGGAIPAGGTVLSATGTAAEWLAGNVAVGDGVDVHLSARLDGRPFELGGDVGIVNGGPRLVRDGAIDIRAFSEGFHRPDEPEFYYRFGHRRNPRTLAGITADGDLLLIAVDGRAPGVSVGASFAESAAITSALGAVDALNLDGGGSTTMTVGDDLVTRPSDPTGERPIADALLLVP